MGKVEQQSEAVAPGISPQTEASKLLEAALMQMDGIISGNSNSARSPHTPEFTVSTPSVRDAVVALVGAIQTHPPPPPPDPVTARTILQWLQGGNVYALSEPSKQQTFANPTSIPVSEENGPKRWTKGTRGGTTTLGPEGSSCGSFSERGGEVLGLRFDYANDSVVRAYNALLPRGLVEVEDAGRGFMHSGCGFGGSGVCTGPSHKQIRSPQLSPRVNGRFDPEYTVGQRCVTTTRSTPSLPPTASAGGGVVEDDTAAGFVREKPPPSPGSLRRQFAANSILDLISCKLGKLGSVGNCSSGGGDGKPPLSSPAVKPPKPLPRLSLLTNSASTPALNQISMSDVTSHPSSMFLMDSSAGMAHTMTEEKSTSRTSLSSPDGTKNEETHNHHQVHRLHEQEHTQETRNPNSPGNTTGHNQKPERPVSKVNHCNGVGRTIYHKIERNDEVVNPANRAPPGNDAERDKDARDIKTNWSPQRITPSVSSSVTKPTRSSATPIGASTSATSQDAENSIRCLGSAYKLFTSVAASACKDPPPPMKHPRTVASSVGGDVSDGTGNRDGVRDQRGSVFSTATAADEDFASAVKDFQVTAQEVQNIVHLEALTKSHPKCQPLQPAQQHLHQQELSPHKLPPVVYRNINGASYINGFHNNHSSNPNHHNHQISNLNSKHHQIAASNDYDDHDSQSQAQTQRFSSTTDYSGTASDDEDEEDSNDVDSSSETDTSSSDSERNLVVRDGLETITEEDRVTASSVHSVEDAESSSPDDDSTLKDNPTWSTSNRESTSDNSTSSSTSKRKKCLKDSSMRCNGDFQWIRQEIPLQTAKSEHLHKHPPPIIMEEQQEEQYNHRQNHHQQPPPQPQTNPQSKPPINRSTRDKTPRRHSDKGTSSTPATSTSSLDRRRHHLHQNRQERDQKSKSTHCPAKTSPPKYEDYYATSCQQPWCCGGGGPWQPEPPPCYENFHRRHERMDPQRYGSSPMLMEHQQRYERGSHPDLYSHRHDGGGGSCCAYHMMLPPPMSCCHYGDARNYWASVVKPPEQDERIRKLQSEKDNLQLQVAVLNEQIEAQCDKIGELEKALADKKHQLGNAEELLQREMLSRSSLETQKLEFMTALSELKLQQASLERENMELKSHQYNNNSGIKKPPLLPRSSPQPQLTSTPIHHSSNQMLNVGVSPTPSPVYAGSFAGLSPRRIDSGSLQQQQQQQLPPPKTPPANYRRQIDLHYGSLPRQQFISNGGTLSTVDSNANPSNVARKGVAFGKGFSTLLGGKAKGQSVPNLADTEKIMIDDDDNSSQQSPSLQFNKNKGIKKIFGRMRRSGSGNLEDLPGEGEFKRGGVRATAGPRLGWSDPPPREKPQAPFVEWDTEAICDWLQDLGLDSYVTEAKRWVKSGAQLQSASINEVEKELGIKNAMHRKKLQLALMDAQENATTDTYLAAAGQLDTAWVLRWLDDTGLPQHKEAFLQNGIDGRMLHRMTMDDLAALHVTSLLHVCSLKRGIQVLREHNFEPGCLQRRSLPDDCPQPLPQQVALWTSHRVMEWLRAVDLAEYAPNLRGAGVHGALMVLEQKFTAELLAALLSIPPSKTLLRRHLNTHFKELLGRDIIQEKRDAEATLGYIPLTPASKLKITKKSQFSLKRKKSKGEMDYGDLVCPLNSSQSGDLNGSTISNNSVGMMKMEEVKEEDVCLHVDSPNLSRSGTPSPRHHESN